MKVLFISHIEEDQEEVYNLMKGNFPKVQLVHVKEDYQAIELVLGEGGFNIFIIEVSNHKTDPNKLAREILETVGEVPIIFLGTTLMINSRIKQDIFKENDTISIVKKPIDYLEFKNSMQASVVKAREDEFENAIIDVELDDYLPMRLKNFYLFNRISFDVYMEVTSTKFMKIINKDKLYTTSSISNLAQKGVTYLFLRKEEKLKFLEEQCKELKEKLLDEDMNNIEHIKLQMRSISVTLEYLKAVGTNDLLVELIIQTINSIALVYSRSFNFKEILSTVPFKQRDIIERSLFTAYLCEAIVDSIGWDSNLTRNKLGLASIIHDCKVPNEEMITIDDISPDNPNFKRFSIVEQTEYRNHPLKAAEVARSFMMFTETDFIIEHHHEKPKSAGFPQGLNSYKIPSVSCIFIMACDFVNHMTIQGHKMHTVKKIVHQFEEKYFTGKFRKPMLALRKAIK